MSSLLVEPCSSDAASYAVMHWHYSARMPIGKLVKIGVWEDEQFRGAVIFGRGASPNLGSPFDLDHTECCELVRIALETHDAPVSQIIPKAVAKLKAISPGIRLIVSYADPKQGHLGRIYQAANWIYTGLGGANLFYYFEGRWQHNRNARDSPNSFTGGVRLWQAINAGHITLDELPQRFDPGKFRYVLPLDRAIRRRVEPMRLPYPGDAELAEQVSKVRHRPTRLEGEVQSLGSAPQTEGAIETTPTPL